MKNNISQLQNTQQNLDYLAAQRVLYTNAKKVTAIQIILNTPVIILLSIAAPILSSQPITQSLGIPKTDISWVAAFFGVVVAILDVALLEPLSKKIREKAARAQELFDCAVLGIPWNEVATGDKPDHEEIINKSKDLTSNQEELLKIRDWYSNKLDNIPTEAARIICQRTNLWWDADLRNFFSNSIIALAIFLFLTLLGISTYQGLTIKNFFLSVFAPSLPALIFSIKQYIENKSAITQLTELTELKTLLNNTWNDILSKKIREKELNETSRKIQDQIYANRKNNPLIFNCIYELRKQKQHTEMGYSTEKMLEEYEQKIYTKSNQGVTS